MTTSKGMAASGHPATSAAAADVLRAGGNAFDAVLGAMCAACVAEPLLVSLGGGGFLLAAGTSGPPVVYDFFCQTPSRKRDADQADFYPILADFGAATQEFHIGMGSIAVPGLVAGLFEVHRDRGRMPLADVLQPAIALARDGVELNALQRYIMRILDAILKADEAAFALYESPSRPGSPAETGETLRNPDLANALQALADEGSDLFYRGEWAQRLARDSRERGGHLSREDLANYRVHRREPLAFRYRNAECLINPPPSPGGCLIAFALKLFENWLPADSRFGDAEHARALLRAMRAASLARARYGLAEGLDRDTPDRVLAPETLAEWHRGLEPESLFSRGTSHISVADAEGNVASLTASNGEGSAYVLPDTGIMLNNMLGEEDLNPAGFGRWPPGMRLASMMSPAIVRDGDRVIALGSGGSNRIRSAILQVTLNIAGYGLGLQEAVEAPRMHLEGHKLSVESGWDPAVVRELRRLVPEVEEWPEPNLFFGGVHTVAVRSGGRFEGMGDPRRDGVVSAV
ncbi:gamma-glutamyltransferase [Elongatibacter sediminis]|uniref:Glutathione hydrolase proenzyme n=1 Tax=Elongatibacter sediminis TaxID=3119006 RepID=A0AAW9RCD8_9GAMM